MKIGKHDLDEDVLIVAEIGNNHEGSYALAEEMVGLAARAGAGAVKFQTIVPQKLVSAQETERIAQLERFRLTHEEFEKLSRVAQQEGVMFLSTPFDLDSVGFLDPLVPAFKIASGDNNFYPLIERVAETGKPILLSTGFMTLDEIGEIVVYIRKVWQNRGITQELAALHCVVSYPAEPEAANLRALQGLRDVGVTVGYSDHTIGIEAAVLSVALGARIIEKHFTLDKNHSDFRDHQLSADPADMAALVERVGHAIELLGSGHKELAGMERENLPRVRRSITASQPLSAGSLLRSEHLCWVRPGEGLPPGREEELLGKALLRPVEEGEMIRLEDVR